MVQTSQEAEIIQKYLEIQHRMMKDTHQEFEHVHHMLHFWKNTTFHSSFATPSVEPSYYDSPENRQHESNMVINNVDLRNDVIPKFGISVPHIMSPATSNFAATSTGSMPSTFEPPFMRRSDRSRRIGNFFAPYTHANRCPGGPGSSSGSGLLPILRSH